MTEKCRFHDRQLEMTEYKMIVSETVRTMGKGGFVDIHLGY